jgi:TolB protein
VANARGDFRRGFGVLAVGVASIAAFSGSASGDVSRPVTGSTPAWSPSGRLIAFSGNLKGQMPDIYVMTPAGTQIRAVTSGDLTKTSPAWSPDSRRIAYSAGDEIDSIRLDGTDRRRLYVGSGPCCPAWSADGKNIAISLVVQSRFTRIAVMNRDGRHVRTVASAPGGLVTYNFPTWSPNGKSIAFSALTNSPATGTPQRGVLALVASTGRGRIRRLRAGRAPAQPDWSPDGRRIVFTDILANSDRIEVLTLRTGRVARLAPGQHPSWSPDGKRIVYSCGGPPTWPYICVMNADGSHNRRL